MLTSCAAMANNQALEIALFSGLLLVTLRVCRHGRTWRRSGSLGALLALGLLTKISFLGALPVLGLLLAWQLARLWRARGKGWQELGYWLPILLLPVLLGGWYYRDAVLSAGGSLIRRFGTPPAAPRLGLLPFLLQYDWISRYESVVKAYWGNFGQLDAPLPYSASTFPVWVTCIAAWEGLWWLVRRLTSRRGPGERACLLGYLFLAAGTLGYMAFVTYLDYRMKADLGGRFGIQARYFLPPIPGQMALLLLGLLQPAPPRLRRAWTWTIGLAMIALNLYAVFQVRGPRYYGTTSLLLLSERAAVLQPVSPAVALGMGLLFLGLAVATAVAMWRALDGEDGPVDD